MAASENNVLVLCQRKSGKDGAGHDVKNVVIPKLEKYLSTLVESPRIMYMSPGLGEEHPDVDYTFALGKDQHESDTFLSGHRNSYQLIVYQTCGFAYMVNTIPYVYDLLQKDGIVIFTAFTHNKEQLVNLSETTVPDAKTFVTEFFRYFEPITSIINKKRDVILPSQEVKSLGKRKRSCKRSCKRSTKKYYKKSI